MFCAHCQREIADYSNYCYFCGSRQHTAAPARPPLADKRLVRSQTDRMIAGVCAGFADYLGVETTVMRLIVVAVTFFTGIVPGVLAYFIAWIIMPETAPGPSAAPPAAGSKRLMRSVADSKIAGVCGGMGEYSGVDPTLVRFIWLVLTIIPGAIIGGILAYLVAWMIIPLAPVPVSKPVTQAS